MVVLVAYRGNLGGLLVVQWLACRGILDGPVVMFADHVAIVL